MNFSFHTDTFVYSEPLQYSHGQEPKHQKSGQPSPHYNRENPPDTLCVVGLGLFLLGSGALVRKVDKRAKLELSAKLLHGMQTVNRANGDPSRFHIFQHIWTAY